MAALQTVMGGVYVAVGLLALVLVRVGLANRDKPGSTGFVLTTGGIAVWSILNGLAKFTADYWLSLGAFNLIQLCAGLVGVGWFYLSLEYAGRWHETERLLLGLASVPIAFQVVMWTNPTHHLYFTAATTVENGILVPAYGPLFWIHTAYGYGLIALGSALLGLEALDAQGVRRRQAFVLMLAVVPAAVTNVAALMDVGGIAYDLTPFGFILAGSLFAWALFRTRFLDVVPVARRTVMTAMDDGVVVLDAEDTVVDANPAVAPLLGLTEDPVGTTVTDALAAHPSLLDAIADLDDGSRDLTVTADGRARHLNLSVSSLELPGPTDDGRVLVLRDVTPTKRRERQLAERENELDLLRQVITRVFRHNLRNALTVIQVRAGVLAERVEPPANEPVAAIVDESERLTAVSRTARTLGSLVEREGPIEQDLVECAKEAASAVRERHPDADVAVSGVERCRVRASPGLVVALEHLLVTAVEDRAGHGAITVDVARRDSVGEITLSEDGSGVSPWDRGAYRDDGTGLDEDDGDVGLALVDWIVERSAGSLTVGGGTTGGDVGVAFPCVGEDVGDGVGEGIDEDGDGVGEGIGENGDGVVDDDSEDGDVGTHGGRD